jgi:alpha-beta hydrolase superfamily lysophospholipase
MALGPAEGPQLVIAQPLFEEMNRCRTMLVAVARHLAGQGIGCWLPDLPGTGESPRALAEIDWDEWPLAIADACRAADNGHPPFLAALRGGTLIDGQAEVAGRWHCAPASGAALMRDLERAREFAGSPGDPDEHAGYRITPSLADAVRGAEPSAAPQRLVRLESDPLPADRKIDAPPPWRLAEPDPAWLLAAAIAADLTSWLATCAS